MLPIVLLINGPSVLTSSVISSRLTFRGACIVDEEINSKSIELFRQAINTGLIRHVQLLHANISATTAKRVKNLVKDIPELLHSTTVST